MTGRSRHDEPLRTMLRLEQRMLDLENAGDTEIAHAEADAILCEALRIFGASQLVAFYENVPKWYA